MKLKYIYLLLILWLASFGVFGQQTVSDVVIPDDIGLTIQDRFEDRTVVGKVVGVHDGDTATVLDADKRQWKIRFNGIDAPELKMDFGNKSKQNLSDMIFGKEVKVVYNKFDKYGRTVGTVFINGMDVNLEQIKAGLAWHYKKYEDEQTEQDRKTYAEAEIAARNAKKGLWQMPNPTAPWDYRAELKVKQEENRANRQYLTGSKGGCYYLNSSGNKTYVDKKYCANSSKNTNNSSNNSTQTNQSNQTNNSQTTQTTQTTNSSQTTTTQTTTQETKKQDSNKATRTYIKGSRGGCYYLNDKGNKVYVDKELCGQ